MLTWTICVLRTMNKLHVPWARLNKQPRSVFVQGAIGVHFIRLAIHLPVCTSLGFLEETREMIIISESSCARTSAICPPSQIHNRGMRRSACKWLCLEASFQSNVVIPHSRIRHATLFAFLYAHLQDAEVCLQVAAPRSKPQSNV